MERSKISVLIICQNAERTIRRALESLVLFDEVVVIDGGSTDGTEQIVKEFPNAIFHYNKWPGFIAQRNYSLDKANHEWCFMLDADEACTSELQQEIFKIISDTNSSPMYRIVRTEYFLGEEIKYGLGKSEYQERLFQKSRIRYTGGNHHQHLLDGQLITAQSKEVVNIHPKYRILHDIEYGIDDWIKKLPRFVLLVAHEKIAKGRKVSAFEAASSFFLEFFKSYAKSFRGGRVSFTYCLLHALNRALIKIYIYQYFAFSKFQVSKPSEKVKEKSLG